MSGRMRRIRGAVGMGLTWAVGWLPVGAVVGALGAVATGAALGTLILRYGVTFAILGLVGGAIFSGILRFAEGRQSFDELSVGRVATWGAICGLLLAVASIAVGLLGVGARFSVLGIVLIAVLTLLGAASAAGSLALARAADDDELARIRRTAAESGLTTEEVRQLMKGGE